jgi:hypothetical protein
MDINTNLQLAQFLTNSPAKMKVLLFLSQEEEESQELRSILSEHSHFTDQGRCTLGIITDESSDAETLFQLFNVEYVPTCLLLNADNSILCIVYNCKQVSLISDHLKQYLQSTSKLKHFQRI